MKAATHAATEITASQCNAEHTAFHLLTKNKYPTSYYIYK